jgi:HTH-type transcriptional regulator / antitoxin HipB
MPSTQLNLGDIVRFHRKKSGLTQSELAKLASIGKAAVYDLEHGTKSTRLDTLYKVLHVLNIKLNVESPLMQTYWEQRKGVSDATSTRAG